MMGRLWMSLMVGKSNGDALEAYSHLNVLRSTLRSRPQKTCAQNQAVHDVYRTRGPPDDA